MPTIWTSKATARVFKTNRTRRRPQLHVFGWKHIRIVESRTFIDRHSQLTNYTFFRVDEKMQVVRCFRDVWLYYFCVYVVSVMFRVVQNRIVVAERVEAEPFGRHVQVVQNAREQLPGLSWKTQNHYRTWSSSTGWKAEIELNMLTGLTFQSVKTWW